MRPKPHNRLGLKESIIDLTITDHTSKPNGSF